MKKTARGFTLLELLIVIGIIGVIMALATVAYSQAQIGGRNARRKQDLVAVQNALEQYYSANNYAYPIADCKTADTYLRSSWPVDPNTDVDYDGVASCTATDYCICAVLEGAASGNSGAACDWNGDKTNFCVAALQ